MEYSGNIELLNNWWWIRFQKVYKKFILYVQTDSQREQIIAAKDSIINNLTGAYDASILDPAPTCLRNEIFQNSNTTKLKIFSGAK